MEDRIAGHSPAEAIAGVAAPVAWRDLRDWLDLVEANGLLKHIAAPVEPDEELGAITLLATRREDGVMGLHWGARRSPMIAKFRCTTF